MSEQTKASGAQVPCISLLTHLLGMYAGMALCATFLPKEAIISGVVFATLNMVAFWWNINRSNKELCVTQGKQRQESDG